MALENLVNKTISKTKKRLKSLAYAGLVGAAVMGGVRGARAETINSNSIVKDNIEYYMQTDKSVYNLRLREDVEMLYRVTNLGSEDVNFNIILNLHEPLSVFEVRKDNLPIWANNLGPINPVTVDHSFTLSPNEYTEFNESWDMYDTSNLLVNTGDYYIKGYLNLNPQNLQYVPVSVSIDIIPEPTTTGLLRTGIASLLAYLAIRRKNN